MKTNQNKKLSIHPAHPMKDGGTYQMEIGIIQ
jgi:hypothetical protein